jgi:hypothetical protein
MRDRIISSPSRLLGIVQALRYGAVSMRGALTQRVHVGLGALIGVRDSVDAHHRCRFDNVYRLSVHLPRQMRGLLHRVFSRLPLRGGEFGHRVSRLSMQVYAFGQSLGHKGKTRRNIFHVATDLTCAGGHAFVHALHELSCGVRLVGHVAHTEFGTSHGGVVLRSLLNRRIDHGRVIFGQLPLKMRRHMRQRGFDIAAARVIHRSG